MPASPRLYDELAPWWPLLSAPSDYAEEALLYREILVAEAAAAGGPPPRTLLELGSGGGNNASHLKAWFELTLVDRSPAMLAVSRALNPGCEHVPGDMRDVRLGRLFDAVFVHDAVMYLTAPEELAAMARTAFVHCRTGGLVLLAPDFVRETFAPSTTHGGHDGEDGRALRYLNWLFDPDPADAVVVSEFALLLRDGRGGVRAVHERHAFGLFARDEWRRGLEEAGFAPPRVVPDRWGRELFVAPRPASGAGSPPREREPASARRLR